MACFQQKTTFLDQFGLKKGQFGSYKGQLWPLIGRIWPKNGQIPSNLFIKLKFNQIRRSNLIFLNQNFKIRINSNEFVLA
jgi:hypothetical protein